MNEPLEVSVQYMFYVTVILCSIGVLTQSAYLTILTRAKTAELQEIYCTMRGEPLPKGAISRPPAFRIE
jgi:hypothetical protein